MEDVQKTCGKMSVPGDKVSLLASRKIFCSKLKGLSPTQTGSAESSSSSSSSSSPLQAVSDVHRYAGGETRELCIGCRVLVGGAKEGVLKFRGKVHFMDGDWCGIELDEREGLHDGVVEQVRYFTCKGGHGIFAPFNKVTLAPDRKPPDHRSQNSGKKSDVTAAYLLSEHSEHYTNASNSAQKTDEVCQLPVLLAGSQDRPPKPSKLARPMPASSLEVEPKEALIHSRLPRPKSAVAASSHDVPPPSESHHVRRSSLVDFHEGSKERHEGATSRRVTFDDTLEYDHLSSRLSYKLYEPDFSNRGYASNEGSYYSTRRHSPVDPYTALTLTYGLESSPPRKKSRPVLGMEDLKKLSGNPMTSGKSSQTKFIQIIPEQERVNAASRLSAECDRVATKDILLDSFENMEEELSGIRTPDVNDIQMIIPDSLTSSEEDARRTFSFDNPKSAVVLRRRGSVGPECSAGIRSREGRNVGLDDDVSTDVIKEPLGACKLRGDLPARSRDEFRLSPRVKIAPALVSGEIQAVTKRASFELARTALAQYADLIRAAQEEMHLRMAKASTKPKPPTPVCSVELDAKDRKSDLSSEFDVDGKSKDEADGNETVTDLELSDGIDSVSFEASASHSVLDEYEMFDGEDLRTIRADDVLIASEDDEGPDIGSNPEDVPQRLASNGKLDLEDLAVIKTASKNDNNFQLQTTENLSDFGNLQPTAIHLTDADQESEVDLLNTVNHSDHSATDIGVLVAPVLIRRRQARPDSMVSTASSDAGIVEDILPGYGAKYDRPISLISSTSSTDTGCPMEADSELTSSMLFSSTLDDLAESWQETNSYATSHSEPQLISDDHDNDHSISSHQFEALQHSKNHKDEGRTGIVENYKPEDGNEHYQKKNDPKDKIETGGSDDVKQIVECGVVEQESGTDCMLLRESSDINRKELRFEEGFQDIIANADQNDQRVGGHKIFLAANEDQQSVSDALNNTNLEQMLSADEELEEVTEISNIVKAKSGAIKSTEQDFVDEKVHYDGLKKEVLVVETLESNLSQISKFNEGVLFAVDSTSSLIIDEGFGPEHSRPSSSSLVVDDEDLDGFTFGDNKTSSPLNQNSFASHQFGNSNLIVHSRIDVSEKSADEPVAAINSFEKNHLLIQQDKTYVNSVSGLLSQNTDIRDKQYATALGESDDDKYGNDKNIKAGCQKKSNTVTKELTEMSDASVIQEISTGFQSTEHKITEEGKKLNDEQQDENQREVAKDEEFISTKPLSVTLADASIREAEDSLQNVNGATSQDFVDKRNSQISELESTGVDCVTVESVVTEYSDRACSEMSQETVTTGIMDNNVLGKMEEPSRKELENEFEANAQGDGVFKQVAVTTDCRNKLERVPDMTGGSSDSSTRAVKVPGKNQSKKFEKSQMKHESKRSATSVQALNSNLKGKLTRSLTGGDVDVAAAVKKHPAKIQKASKLTNPESRRPDVEGQIVIPASNNDDGPTGKETSSKSNHITQRSAIKAPGKRSGPAKRKDSSALSVKPADSKGTGSQHDNFRSAVDPGSKSVGANVTLSRRKDSVGARQALPFRATTKQPPTSRRNSHQAHAASAKNPPEDLTKEGTKPNSVRKQSFSIGAGKKKSDGNEAERPGGTTKAIGHGKQPSVAASSRNDSSKAGNVGSTSRSRPSVPNIMNTGGKVGTNGKKSVRSLSVPSALSTNRRDYKAVGENKQAKEPTVSKSSPRNQPPAKSSQIKHKDDSDSQLISQLEEIRAQLKKTQQQLDEVLNEREGLHVLTMKLKEEKEMAIEELHTKHQNEIETLKKAFSEQTKVEVNQVLDQHSREVKSLKCDHERQLSETKNNHEVELETQKKEHQDAITRLDAKHLEEIREAKASHEHHLNEISERFEEIKISLSSKVEQLRGRCDELCSRELSYKDTCKRESDLRQQATLEVDSLRVVLEQKSVEMRKLRQNCALLEEKVQKIPQMKETVIRLQQKIENLEAVNNIKSDHERQLADMHQTLLRKFECESKAMKRLSMENEELMWRLSQSDYGPSCLQEKSPAGDASGMSALMSQSYDCHRMTRVDASFEDATGQMSKSYDGFSDFSSPSATMDTATMDTAEPVVLSAAGAAISQMPVIKLRRSGTYEVMGQEKSGKKL